MYKAGAVHGGCNPLESIRTMFFENDIYLMVNAVFYVNTRSFLPVYSFKFHKGAIAPGLKVGQMTQTNWVTLITFLVAMGQVGLIYKLNYHLDVAWISHVL